MLLAGLKIDAMMKQYPRLIGVDICLPGNLLKFVGHPSLFLYGGFRGGDFAKFRSAFPAWLLSRRFW